jgi:hypothetical protein
MVYVSDLSCRVIHLEEREHRKFLTIMSKISYVAIDSYKCPVSIRLSCPNSWSIWRFVAIDCISIPALRLPSQLLK